MLQLNLPLYKLKTKKDGGITYLWDRIRRKYLVATPEEWVRQHFVNYLIEEKGFPESLLANEIQIEYNKQKKRCDTVVYNNRLEPLAIVEYKAPNVAITQLVFDQIVRYNMVLKVSFLIVSNGLEHYCCRVDYNRQVVEYLEVIPNYSDLQ